MQSCISMFRSYVPFRVEIWEERWSRIYWCMNGLIQTSEDTLTELVSKCPEQNASILQKINNNTNK